MSVYTCARNEVIVNGGKRMFAACQDLSRLRCGCLAIYFSNKCECGAEIDSMCQSVSPGGFMCEEHAFLFAMVAVCEGVWERCWSRVVV